MMMNASPGWIYPNPKPLHPDTLTLAYGLGEIPQLLKKIQTSAPNVALKEKALIALCELFRSQERVYEGCRGNVLQKLGDLLEEGTSKNPVVICECASKAVFHCSMDAVGRRALLENKLLMGSQPGEADGGPRNGDDGRQMGEYDGTKKSQLLLVTITRDPSPFVRLFAAKALRNVCVHPDGPAQLAPAFPFLYTLVSLPPSPDPAEGGERFISLRIVLIDVLTLVSRRLAVKGSHPSKHIGALGVAFPLGWLENGEQQPTGSQLTSMLRYAWEVCTSPDLDQSESSNDPSAWPHSSMQSDKVVLSELVQIDVELLLQTTLDFLLVMSSFDHFKETIIHGGCLSTLYQILECGPQVSWQSRGKAWALVASLCLSNDGKHQLAESEGWGRLVAEGVNEEAMVVLMHVLQTIDHIAQLPAMRKQLRDLVPSVREIGSSHRDARVRSFARFAETQLTWTP